MDHAHPLQAAAPSRTAVSTNRTPIPLVVPAHALAQGRDEGLVAAVFGGQFDIQADWRGLAWLDVAFGRRPRAVNH